MKYLKTYKLFETIGYSELTDEMWNDISDILLELEDIGFFITKDISDVKLIDKKLCNDVVEIIIDKHQQKFSFSDIEETVRRLIEYMSQFGFNYSLMCFNVYSFAEFECGGPHHLSKEREFKSEAEKILHKSLLDKIIKDTQSFKINFYSDIDRIIGESHSNINEVEDDVRDILLELEDTGLFQVEIDRTRKDKQSSSVKDYSEIFLEVRIMRPWNSPQRYIPGAPEPPGGTYPGDIFLWKEIKDVIVRLNQWYYEYSGNEITPGISGKTAQELSKIGIKYNSNSPFRMFSSGVGEFGVGWHKPEDFDNLGDFISFTSLRIEMKL